MMLKGYHQSSEHINDQTALFQELGVIGSLEHHHPLVKFQFRKNKPPLTRLSEHEPLLSANKHIFALMQVT